MKTRMRHVIWSALLGLSLAMPGVVGAEVRVIGEGRVSAVPDMARLTLGVEAEGATAAEALGTAGGRIEAVLAVLTAEGIAAADMQTSELTVQPVYVHARDNEAPPRIRGYIASSQLTVRVREIDALGGLIDAVVEAGGNTFSGISFDVADPKPLMIEARREAVADAMAKAALFAGAAGVSLGEVTSITEVGAYPVPGPMMEAAMDMRAMPVAAGEIEVVATITMVFDLGE